jgi:ribosomal protein S3
VQVQAAHRPTQLARLTAHAIAQRLSFESTFRKANDVVDLALEPIGRGV